MIHLNGIGFCCPAGNDRRGYRCCRKPHLAGERLLVRTVLQDGGHALVAGMAEAQGPGTGGLQALGAVAQTQAQEILYRAQIG